MKTISSMANPSSPVLFSGSFFKARFYARTACLSATRPQFLAWRLVIAGVATLGALTLSQPVGAATIYKADNADNLNLASSWTNGVAPGAADIAQWDATVTAPNSVVLGADLNWKGITVTGPGGPVTIGAGNTLTLGTSGINLGAATQPLTINSGLTLGPGNQVWNASGQSLTLGTGVFTRGPGATLNVAGGYTVMAGNIANDATGIIGAWASVGSGASTGYGSISGGYIVGYYGTYATDATAVTDTTGVANYDVYAPGALGTGASFNTLRYLGAAGTISNSFTANGVMNAGTGGLTLSGGVTIGSSKQLGVSCANNSITFTGVITNNGAGASSLVKNGSSQLIIGGGSAVANTYSGGTWINQGVLQLKDSVGGNALGSGNVYVASGATLYLRPSTSLPKNKVTIAGAGGGSFPGAIYLSAVSPIISSVALSGNASITSDSSSGDGLTLTNVDLSACNLTLGGGMGTKSMPISINGVIQGTGGLTLNAANLTIGTVTLTLNRANTYSGDTVLKVGSGVTTGVASLVLGHVNALQNSTLDLDVEDAQKYIGFGVSGTNTYYLGGLKGTDTLNINYNTVNVGGNGQNTTYAGSIINKTGVGSVIKSGSGTLTLTGTNTFNGSTTISAGTLALSGNGSIASPSITNWGTFDVSAVTGGYHLLAGTALTGTGSVTGPITVDAGATLTVGGSSGTAGLGTMAVTGNLTLNGNTVLRLNKGGTSDQITATGTLALGGNLNLYVVGAALANGDEFQIFSANNSGTPAITGNPGAGLQWDSSLLNSQGKIKVVAGSNPPVLAVSLTNQTVECSSNAAFVAVATGTAPLVYTWSVNGTPVASGVDLTTYTTNNVHAAGSTYTVSVQVTNLVSSASSSCTLSVVDTTGPVITLAGYNPMSVLVGQPFAEPGATASDGCAGAVTVLPSGTVDTNNPGSYTITYTAADGNGNSSTATRTVNVVASQSGIWTNTTGGLWMSAANWTNGLVALGPDATADFSQIDITSDRTVQLDQPVTVGNLVFGDKSGTQNWTLGNNSNLTNVLTLAVSSGTASINNTVGVTISAQVTGTNGLTKSGSGTLTLAPGNTYSGGTWINEGEIRLGAGGTNYLGTGDVRIASGARLRPNVNSPQTLPNNFIIAGTGTSSSQGAIYVNDGVTLSLQGTLSLGDNALISSATTAGGNINFQGINLGGYTLTLNSGVIANSQSWNINGPITGEGGGSLTVGAPSLTTGSFTLTLAGTNSYTGNTTINGGGLVIIPNANALPGWDTAGRFSVANNATLAVGNDVNDAAVATLLGTGNFQAGSSLGFDASAGARACALDLADPNGNVLGLLKLGNYALTLSGANTYSGITEISVGLLSITTTAALPGWNANGRYTVANSATLAVGNDVNDAAIATMLATTNFNAGARIGFDTTAGNRTYAGALANTSQGNLGFTKFGDNTLTLSGVNTYSGVTRVNAGTLAVNGVIGTNSVTVATNATLGGYGQVNGAVTVQGGGSLNLGSAVGTLTISNTLTLQTNSLLTMKLAKGTSPASDLVRGVSTLTYGGTLNVATTSGMAALAAGDSFQLFQATNYAGAFAATNLPSLPASLAWVWMPTNGTLSVVSAGAANPTANPDVATTPWNVPLTLAPLANDTDPASLPLTLVSVSPSNGTASIVNGTNVLFTASQGFVGPASIGYTLTNGNGGTASSLITVTVTAPPKAGISSVTRSGTSLVLSGTNGAPNGIYSVLTSTNVALALTNWVPVLTNTFDGNGRFTENLPVNTTVPKSFFLLKQ